MTTPTQDDRSAAVNYMLSRWSDAHSMRYVGKCPACKQWTLWSAVRPADEKVADQPRYKDKGVEPCFHFCTRTRCEFSDATTRPIDDPELDDTAPPQRTGGGG